MSEKAFKGCGCTKIIDGELVATGDYDCIAPKLVEALEAVVAQSYLVLNDDVYRQAKSALAAAYGETSK
jgi:hypothetical protein